jgi:hypothetical protein
MQLAADVLMILGALGAALYCIVLSKRLKRFSDLENGVGGAIAVLSAQVDDMTKSLESARKIAQSSAVSLDGVTERAEAASRRLELLMASLHDLPEERLSAAVAGARGAAAARAQPAAEPEPDPSKTFFSIRHRAKEAS